MKRSVVSVFTVVAILVFVAGCAASPGSPTGTIQTPAAQQPVTSPSDPATAASNRTASATEAARLIALAQAPPGALVTDPAGSVLTGPVTGTPSVTSMVTQTRSWKINLPFAQALAWVRAHPPAGLTSGGRSTASVNGVHNAGDEYNGPVTQAWSSAQLQIGAAELTAATSMVRADALVIWLDPAPYQDTFTGRRMRVLVAGGCPHRDAGVAGVRNTGSDLSNRLLPAAEPTAGLVCRYSGMNGRPFTLTGTGTLSSAAAGQFAAAVARQRLAHTRGGMHSCPMDDASVTVVALSYPGRADVDLWLTTSGCQSTANGVIYAGSTYDSELDNILEQARRLLRPPQPTDQAELGHRLLNQGAAFEGHAPRQPRDRRAADRT